jgi:hypothetical protein
MIEITDSSEQAVRAIWDERDAAIDARMGKAASEWFAVIRRHNIPAFIDHGVFSVPVNERALEEILRDRPEAQAEIAAIDVETDRIKQAARDVANAKIAALGLAPVMTAKAGGAWIDIKDRLPDEGQEVTVCTFEGMGIGTYIDGEFEVEIFDGLGGDTRPYPGNAVSHWMPA